MVIESVGTWIVVACKDGEAQARRIAISSEDKRSMIASYAERKKRDLIDQ
jgi:hypothetical protein